MRVAVASGGASAGRGGCYHLESLQQGTMEEAAMSRLRRSHSPGEWTVWTMRVGMDGKPFKVAIGASYQDQAGYPLQRKVQHMNPVIATEEPINSRCEEHLTSLQGFKRL